MSDELLAGLVDESRRLSALLDAGLSVLRESGERYARAEKTYREIRATAILRSVGTVAEREATADLASLDAREERDLADSLRSAALESVRSRRQQLSALQSILAAHRAEAEYVRTGPSSRP